MNPAGAREPVWVMGEAVPGPLRIVSLVPSLTELLCALGLASRLVGRTGFCIHPRDTVRRIPKVGGTKDVSLDRVRALTPTHVVVNVDENRREAVEALGAFVPSIVVTHPIEVEDNLALYRRFGALFGGEARAATLAAALSEELARTRREPWAPIRVLYLIWREPWMTVGPDTYIAKTLAEAGLHAVAPASGARYPVVDFDRFGGDRFDAVLLSSEPYRFTPAHADALRADPRLGGRPVLAIDGEMTSWYGARAIEGLRYLRGFRRTLEAHREVGHA